MTYRPGTNGEVGTVELVDEEAVAAQSTLADRVEASFAQFATDSHPAITAFEPVAERDFNQTFLLGADHAVDANLTLWVDDFALKELVRQQGGHAFGTPELMVHLRTEGIIDEALVDLAEAHLIAAGYVGSDFAGRSGTSPRAWPVRRSVSLTRSAMPEETTRPIAHSSRWR